MNEVCACIGGFAGTDVAIGMSGRRDIALDVIEAADPLDGVAGVPGVMPGMLGAEIAPPKLCPPAVVGTVGRVRLGGLKLKDEAAPAPLPELAVIGMEGRAGRPLPF